MSKRDIFLILFSSLFFISTIIVMFATHIVITDIFPWNSWWYIVPLIFGIEAAYLFITYPSENNIFKIENITFIQNIFCKILSSILSVVAIVVVTTIVTMLIEHLVGFIIIIGSIVGGIGIFVGLAYLNKLFSEYLNKERVL